MFRHVFGRINCRQTSKLQRRLVFNSPSLKQKMYPFPPNMPQENDPGYNAPRGPVSQPLQHQGMPNVAPGPVNPGLQRQRQGYPQPPQQPSSATGQIQQGFQRPAPLPPTIPGTGADAAPVNQPLQRQAPRPSQPPPEIPRPPPSAPERQDSEPAAKAEESFALMLRNSKLLQMGDPDGRIVMGEIIRVMDDDLYIDFGGKFHCVCKRPMKDAKSYALGVRVRLQLHDLELSSRFMGSSKDLTLLEAEATLLGLFDNRVVAMTKSQYQFSGSHPTSPQQQ